MSNYFPPVHLQPFIAGQYGHAPGDFPLAESVSRRTIALPFYNHLTQDEVAIVCGVLRGVLDACLHVKRRMFHINGRISTLRNAFPPAAAFAFRLFVVDFE